MAVACEASWIEIKDQILQPLLLHLSFASGLGLPTHGGTARFRKADLGAHRETVPRPLSAWRTEEWLRRQRGSQGRGGHCPAPDQPWALLRRTSKSAPKERRCGGGAASATRGLRQASEWTAKQGHGAGDPPVRGSNFLAQGGGGRVQAETLRHPGPFPLSP